MCRRQHDQHRTGNADVAVCGRCCQRAAEAWFASGFGMEAGESWESELGWRFLLGGEVFPIPTTCLLAVKP